MKISHICVIYFDYTHPLYLPPTYPRSLALSSSQIHLLNCLFANNLESYWRCLQAHDNGARVTYQCCTPKTVTFSSSAAINCQLLLCQGWDCGDPSSFRVGVLTGSVLWRSRAGTHSCCALVCATAMPSPEVSVSRLSSLPASSRILSLPFPECSLILNWGRLPEMTYPQLSTHLYLAVWPVMNLCINHQ